MINNNAYTIPQKKPLTHSKIYSDINASRHSSTHMQTRPSNDVMYNSSIFMKNSSIMNLHSEPSFFQPIREPLSPHSNYSKQPQSVNFFPPPYSSNVNNIPTLSTHQTDNSYFPINASKDISIERTLNELRDKIDGLQKKLQSHERNNLGVSETKLKKNSVPNEIDSLILKIQDSVINSDRLKQVIGNYFTEHFESQTKPIWQKVKDLDESFNFSSTNISNQKLNRLQESFLRSQSQKLHEQQLMNRIKTIEKTIRQMGEDIHLVNDKQEGLSAKIENELPWLRSEVKGLRALQKKYTEIEQKNSQLKQDLDLLLMKTKSFQISLASSSQSNNNISSKIRQIDIKLNNLNPKQPTVSRSFDKYPAQPIILKYLEKFQISKNSNRNNLSYSRERDFKQEILINQMTYYIDQDGYLLDKDSYYLVNAQKGQKVRLSPTHLQILKQKNILI